MFKIGLGRGKKLVSIVRMHNALCNINKGKVVAGGSNVSKDRYKVVTRGASGLLSYGLAERRIS